MNVRDAVESDGGRLAGLAEVPTEVMTDAIHDRTVRVAESRGEVSGFVAFDAREDAVDVSHLVGSEAARKRLLDEPLRFAEREDMAVETLVPDDERGTIGTVEEAGFERVGSGPRFDGRPTLLFRLENP